MRRVRMKQDASADDVQDNKNNKKEASHDGPARVVPTFNRLQMCSECRGLAGR